MSVEEPWTRTQRDVVIASYLGWMLDAFDFFLVVFVLTPIAGDFHARMASVTLAIFVTMAMRPIGALLFGRIADRFGRRGALMASVLLYSLLEFASAFAPTLAVFLVLRALFGIAMGGEWGVGAALAFESVPQRSRGWVSGVLQAGYPSGYLLASIAFGLLYEPIGWRGMFMVGVIPAFILILYIYLKVPESQHFDPNRARSKEASTLYVLRHHGKLALFAIILMTGYNFFSHGTQDLYPTFLQVQHHFDPPTVKNIAVIYNIGAIIGGLFFGSISQGFGRRRTVMLVTLLALPVIYFWAYAATPVALALGAFLMQVCVQGAWGVVPAYLNELAPADARGTFAGTCYQLGNFIASINAVLQAGLAERMGGNYSFALAAVATFAALLICTMMKFGPEKHNVAMGREPVGE